MKLYSQICYLVEDAFVKLLTRRQNVAEVRMKVEACRHDVEAKSNHKKRLKSEALAERKEEAERKRLEIKRLEEIRRAEENKRKLESEAKAHEEVLDILKFIANSSVKSYTPYEYEEVQKNKSFFVKFINQILENGEQGITFLKCKYIKSAKIQYKGYLVVTNKRVWFATGDLMFTEKYRYQTISNVVWANDGLMGAAMHIGYGKRMLIFNILTREFSLL